MVDRDQAAAQADAGRDDRIGLLDLATVLVARWRLLVITPIAIGALALAVTTPALMPPTFTGRTSFLPPQQSQGIAGSALASLGALAGLAGGSVKTPSDQYVSLMQSVTVEDRIIDRFDLIKRYKAKYRVDARKTLESNVRISIGKKDGLITVEAMALTPTMAADMANQYVAELRRITSELALTEAQQRRLFFETELKQARVKLDSAQQALQNGGFNAGAIKAEPQAAAENYARLKAEATTAEVRLQSMRSTLADTAPEVQRQVALLAALHGQLEQLERNTPATGNADYVSRFREFKYQEKLFELFSQQYETARVDESRDGAVVQVVDPAVPPETKSGPKRVLTAIAATFISGLVLTLWVLLRYYLQQARADSDTAEKLRRLRAAWRR
jgi:uncharacterized protein involved in exopolysaccharide biosynthesis